MWAARNRLLFPLLVALACLWPGRASAFPTCEFWEGDATNLTGRIGGTDVRVHLNSGWPSWDEDGVTVWVFDPAKWERREQHDTLFLQGHLIPDCRLALTENGVEKPPTWQLRFVSPERVEGTHVVDGRSESFELIAGRRFDCAAGAWKSFAKAGWPMTFEYPASSRFTAAGSEVLIECPDVAERAWGQSSITVSHVRRVEARRADGQTGTRLGLFVKFDGDVWRIGEDDDCGARPEERSWLLCRDVTRRQWHGFTVLQGNSPTDAKNDNRNYYAFVLGNEAIVVESDELPEDISSLDAPALAGESSLAVAAARVVRSLKRR